MNKKYKVTTSNYLTDPLDSSREPHTFEVEAQEYEVVNGVGLFKSENVVLDRHDVSNPYYKVEELTDNGWEIIDQHTNHCQH